MLKDQSYDYSSQHTMPHTTPENRKRILIIEDDAALLDLYSRALQAISDCQVMQTTTISDARELLDTYHFDLIVCDMEVGHEYANKLLEERQGQLYEEGTQVIAASAKEEYRIISEAAGADIFLMKPVSMIELVNLVQRLLNLTQQA